MAAPLRHRLAKNPPVATGLIEALRAADREALASVLAEDVVFDSPVATYEGRETVLHVLGTVADVVSDLEVDRELAKGDETVSFLTGRIGDERVDGVVAWSVDDAGRVARLTLMLRPLKGLLAGVEEMGRRLGG